MLNKSDQCTPTEGMLKNKFLSKGRYMDTEKWKDIVIYKPFMSPCVIALASKRVGLWHGVGAFDHIVMSLILASPILLSWGHLSKS